MARILALDAYHGGSHKAVVDAWQQRSAHAIDVRSLPPRHWKWRMRHAALSFVEELTTDTGLATAAYDAVWCTDMLDLACWRGLAPDCLRDLPHILYMHENQLLYPDQHKQQRDYHYAFTNYTSCCAADLIAWNSAWHRDQFIKDMLAYMQQMPDYALDVQALHEKSIVLYPGMQLPEALPQLIVEQETHTLPHILWAARWHWEKGPDIFFDALALLGDAHPFDLSVIGGDASRADALFQRAEQTWQHRIKHWGYVAAEDYWPCLLSADVVVSTARHEFFGLAMVEAAAAGCRPILPQRLAYPEVFAELSSVLFYQGASDGTGEAEALAACIQQALAEWAQGRGGQQPVAAQQLMVQYTWDQLLPRWDAAVSGLLA